MSPECHHGLLLLSPTNLSAFPPLPKLYSFIYQSVLSSLRARTKSYAWHIEENLPLFVKEIKMNSDWRNHNRVLLCDLHNTAIENNIAKEIHMIGEGLDIYKNKFGEIR